ncbi:MAG TPA: nitrate ABC transporter substrate-binding protein [Microbacterium sp.]|uniref:ABC transporter substrate-binding protein n=1 Tax=Microbacterium sp. UBA1612 TaxID=1946942 RepID=UPI000E7F06CD|nr:ABC transporter substrate-binding protein [Microbacterium sp. UBA1612]HAM11867.1 nitrate ABC transporter substrate-binding protein [Microbacterium sp.]HAS33264.1 nitrate ABC transporter substrate-binding protein [Microbacterium sp.]HBR88510.1 nitrate ABC transporter substrate-binding protein [Microbacterium sp.]HBS74893.1 nitrate ABC transporter substrate-binding protein [Microbacterium sp.]|tara:strand:+ start:7675 stop:8784 length:1110 start_codon:yes stop_codon:yes gene_type:complete
MTLDTRFTRKALTALTLASASALLLAGCSGDADATDDASASTGVSDMISADRCAENEAAGPITFLTSYAYVASVGLLDVLTAKDQGMFEDMCLDVTIEPGSNNTQLVSAGTAQFAGVGSPSDVMVAIDNGADVSAIATYGNTPAIMLMTNTDISDLSQLEGTTAGYKGAIPPQISAMLTADGVDTASIEWVSVGYDPTILPQGQVDALTGYKSNEPLVLASQGYDVTEWDPADYGIESAFNTQIVNSTFAEEHPTAVEDFLRASFAAYAWINESDENLDAALAYAESLSEAGYDLDLSAQRWKTEVGLVEESQPEGTVLGYQAVDQWTPEADMLMENDLISAEPDIESEIDTSFVEAIYDDGELVWPAP